MRNITFIAYISVHRLKLSLVVSFAKREDRTLFELQFCQVILNRRAEANRPHKATK